MEKAATPVLTTGLFEKEKINDQTENGENRTDNDEWRQS